MTTKTGAVDRKLAVPPTDFLPSHAQHVFEQALTVRIFRCDFCHNLELFHFPPEQPPQGWIRSKA